MSRLEEAEAEAVEEAVAHVPFENRGTARSIVRNLLKHAKPGNWAFHKLQNEWGFDGDYTPADEGMHWSDNR